MSIEYHVLASRYQIVEATDAGVLADLVDEELSLGWTLYGNPMCVSRGTGFMKWSQALIRTS